MKTVVVGLSGGVDSSVAAYLLKNQGYNVIGLFMKNWIDDSGTLNSECSWVEDSNDALFVAEKLNIPFYVINLKDIYKERIVDYMFEEYRKGLTPNPDILCNREIKFDAFMKIALDLGADYIATGHYCRKQISLDINGNRIYHLLSGVDKNKDQSYFLCQLSQEQLGRALFPIGELTKKEVRFIASEEHLITADKKDSQGLCFIGKISLPEFLKQEIKPERGNIIQILFDHLIFSKTEPNIDLSIKEKLSFWSTKREYTPDMGKVVGTHQGAHCFTIGQRKGLAVGGTKEPLFVIGTDIKTNTVYVGEGKFHPGLYSSTLFVSKDKVHWVRKDLALSPGDKKTLEARIRYRQKLTKATLYCFTQGIYVHFNKLQSAITKGQFVAWYQDRELIGSGVIS